MTSTQKRRGSRMIPQMCRHITSCGQKGRWVPKDQRNICGVDVMYRETPTKKDSYNLAHVRASFITKLYYYHYHMLIGVNEEP